MVIIPILSPIAVQLVAIKTSIKTIQIRKKILTEMVNPQINKKYLLSI